jgi:hypothetical protein
MIILFIILCIIGLPLLIVGLLFLVSLPKCPECNKWSNQKLIKTTYNKNTDILTETYKCNFCKTIYNFIN